MITMPGKSHRGALPPLTAEEKQLSARLLGHVAMLAGGIGERNMFNYAELQKSAEYISDRLREMGYKVKTETYLVEGRASANLVVEIQGKRRPEEIVLVGAHYDSVAGSPGANDNASGVAGMLELARRFRKSEPAVTLRFVAFVNEEPPFFMTRLMGSRVYAAEAKKRGDKITAMLSLETIGYYSDASGSQQYPPPFHLFYPDTANFIGFVSNPGSAFLLRRCIESFRTSTRFPSEGLAAPEIVQGVGWSDQWSFWQEGYRGLMVTDTAPFRYPHYHRSSDTPEKLDYDRMARVVEGIGRVVEELVK